LIVLGVLVAMTVATAHPPAPRTAARDDRAARSISEEDLAQAFDPDVACVQARLREARGRLHSIERLARSPNDPSVVNAK